MRLLDLVFYLLKSNSKVTVKELAERFNVSTKTIRRDLDKLSVLGIPVLIYRGPSGGVEIDKNYIIAKHILKRSDYDSLLLALYIGENISETISESLLIDKFKSVDRERCSKLLKNLEQRFVMDLFEEKFDSNNIVCKEINKAIDNKSFINIEIKSKNLEVYPISFVLRKEGLCLYCLNKDYMLILINKISNAAISNKTYDKSIMDYNDNKKNIKLIL